MWFYEEREDEQPILKWVYANRLSCHNRTAYNSKPTSRSLWWWHNVMVCGMWLSVAACADNLDFIVRFCRKESELVIGNGSWSMWLFLFASKWFSYSCIESHLVPLSFSSSGTFKIPITFTTVLGNWKIQREEEYNLTETDSLCNNRIVTLSYQKPLQFTKPLRYFL